MSVIDDLKYNEQGLIPAIVQDKDTSEVLMLAYMNKESLEKTLESGFTHFYSRSRAKLWKKGESSGHVQKVEAVFIDCDKDTLLVMASQAGGACHEGYKSCFFRKINTKDDKLEVTGQKVFDPDKVYE